MLECCKWLFSWKMRGLTDVYRCCPGRVRMKQDKARLRQELRACRLHLVLVQGKKQIGLTQQVTNLSDHWLATAGLTEANINSAQRSSVNECLGPRHPRREFNQVFLLTPHLLNVKITHLFIGIKLSRITHKSFLNYCY